MTRKDISPRLGELMDAVLEMSFDKETLEWHQPDLLYVTTEDWKALTEYMGDLGGACTVYGVRILPQPSVSS